MDGVNAVLLVDALESHPPLTEGILPNRQELVDLLISTPVPPSKRFYESVGDNSQRIPDSGNDVSHNVAIRRILRNNLASDYEGGTLRRLYEAAYDALESRFGAYDSNVMLRKARANLRIAALMQQAHQAGHPYSLSGKLETFDEISGKVSTIPLIIIPGISNQDMYKVLAWELSHINPKRPEDNYKPN